MNARHIVVTAVATALAVAFISRAGNIAPPIGPVSPTSPSLADIQAALLAGTGDNNAYFIAGDCLAKGELEGPASGNNRTTHATSPDFTGTNTTEGYEGGIRVRGVEEQASGDPSADPKPIRILVDRDRAVGEMMAKMQMGMLLQELVVDVTINTGGGIAVVERIHMFDVMICKITCSPTAAVSVIEVKPMTVEKTFNTVNPATGVIEDSYTVTITK